MYTSMQIVNKLNSLVDGAVNAKFDRNKMNALVSTLKTAINNFYNIDFHYYIESDIEAMTHALIRSGMKYENLTVLSTLGNTPTGYNNVTEVFTVGSSIMNTTQSAFNSSIKEVFDVDGVNKIYQSSLVDTWLNEWLNAVTTVPAKLVLISDYASEVGLLSGVKIIFEPPKITSVPKGSEIAEELYIKRGYKEVIEKLGLSVYIPSYI